MIDASALWHGRLGSKCFPRASAQCARGLPSRIHLQRSSIFGAIVADDVGVGITGFAFLHRSFDFDLSRSRESSAQSLLAAHFTFLLAVGRAVEKLDREAEREFALK